MTNVVNMCENVKAIAFSDLNVGDAFEYYGKIYIKYYDDDLEDAFALQIYPADSTQFHSISRFSDNELVSERVCTITIE